MSDGPPFHLTVTGRRFHEHTVPEVARQLARIATALEALAEDPEHEAEEPPESETPPVADPPPT